MPLQFVGLVSLSFLYKQNGGGAVHTEKGKRPAMRWGIGVWRGVRVLISTN